MKPKIWTARVYRALQEIPWAMRPEKLDEILAFLDAHAAGIRAFDDEPRRAAARSVSQRTGAVAVLPIIGLISNRANMLSDFSGGTSLQVVVKDLRALVADDTISAVVLEIDSPGGFVDGVEEFAAEVYAARKTKTIVAVSNTMAASAAYWIAAAASEIVVSPSGEVGSIGVWMVHQDESGAWEAMGVKNTVIYAGKFKTAGNRFEPLSEEAQELLQGRIDQTYASFVGAVAKGRGVTSKDVREGFGQGFIVGAKEAVKLGMADRVATLEETIQRLQNARGRTNTARALVAAMGVRTVCSDGTRDPLE